MDKYDKLYIWHIVTLAKIKCRKKELERLDNSTSSNGFNKIYR